MLTFIKKLFTRPEPAQKGIKLTLTDDVNLEKALSFDIVLGFDVEVGTESEPTIYLKVNRLTFTSNNESAKKYINAMNDGMLKHTISMLCIGASEHILTTPHGFAKNPDMDLTPAADKSQLN